MTPKIIAACFLFVFLAIVFNSALYTHAHSLPDGTLVVHAHPFDRSGGDDAETPENHSHDCFELVWTHAAKDYYPLVKGTPLIVGVVSDIHLVVFDTVFSELPTCPSMYGRAPPCMPSFMS